MACQLGRSPSLPGDVLGGDLGDSPRADYSDVLDALQQKGISIRVASPKLVMEESPESYKDVNDVVDTCHAAQISSKCLKLRPIAVIKG